MTACANNPFHILSIYFKAILNCILMTTEYLIALLQAIIYLKIHLLVRQKVMNSNKCDNTQLQRSSRSRNNQRW